MQSDQSDQELNFKKRARRRLVGAIVLVLLMIVFLPMVLKERTVSSPQEQITITLPEEAVPATSTASDFDSNVVPHEPTQPTEVVQSPTESSGEPAGVEAATTTKPASAPTQTKSEATHKFYVQVGVFSDMNNVKLQQTKLSGLGYKSHTEKIKTDKGEKIRLKTQTFADRNEAAIALEKIKNAGLPGMVVSQ